MSWPERIQKLVVLGLLLLGCTIIFLITGSKVNQYGMIDTLLSLPTSQALWETGHVYLDPYIGRQILPDGTLLDHESLTFRTTTTADGRLVDFFPAGAAILTLPLTAALTQLGFDFFDPGTNLAVQNRLSFVTGSITLLLVFALCRIWLTRWPSVVFTGIAFFGSIIFSTLGTAMWSINYTIIFNLGVVILLSLKAQGRIPEKSMQLAAALMGTLLFLAFFTRVSSVPVILLTLGYLAWTDRRSAVTSGGVAAVLLLMFAGWSWLEYGQLLPPYYALNRIDDTPVPLWVGLLGNLFSPSRGFFVYMPWALVLVGLGFLGRKVWRRPLVVYGASWFLLQLILVSQANIWWGGGSFGPRLLTEAMPGVVLLGLVILDDFEFEVGRGKGVPALLFLGLGVFSIWLHSFQAFFNPYTHWFWYDAAPPIVGDPADDLGPYFDWSVAQWRADERVICQLEEEYFDSIVLPYESTLEPVTIDQTITFGADQNRPVLVHAVESKLAGEVRGAPDDEGNFALFEGLYVFLPSGRWSGCQTAEVHFLADSSLLVEGLQLTLNVQGVVAQRLDLALNGRPLPAVEIGATATQVQVEIDMNMLTGTGINTLLLEPTRQQPPNLEQHGVSLRGDVGVKFIEMVFSQ